MKIFIFGSCVTRDIFRVVNKDEEDITYFARTSFISQMSEPINIEESAIKLNSPFQRNMVIQDFRKNFFSRVENENPDVIILDFIDERFDLLKLGESYVTKSKEFDDGKVIESLPPMEPVKRSDAKKLWEIACLSFIERLRDMNKRPKIYLHEAYWAYNYLDDERNTLEFSYKNAIKSSNALLEGYYDFFKRCMPEVNILSTQCLADTKHAWGLSAYHYTDDYYHSLHNKLRA